MAMTISVFKAEGNRTVIVCDEKEPFEKSEDDISGQEKANDDDDDDKDGQ